jgi:hypothetical protein
MALRPADLPVRQQPAISNNVSVPSGAPGLVIGSTGLMLFTGVIQNTGTASVGVQFETLQGLGPKITFPQGGFVRFVNVHLVRIQTDATAIVSVIGFVTEYANVDDYKAAIELAQIDASNIFTITGQPLARPAHYDRNPLHVFKSSAITAGAATRAKTQDWAYTVPAARKAVIEALYVMVSENLAVVLNGNASALIDLQPSGGALNDLVIAELELSNTGNSIVTYGTSAVLLTGDLIAGYSRSNNSAAGSNVLIYENGKFTEFDA